jgi:solute carrier family 25 folate transporter 32
MSSDGMVKRVPPGGIISTTKKMVMTEGWKSLYKGLSINLIRTVPNSAVTMLTYVKLYLQGCSAANLSVLCVAMSY